MEGPKNSFVTQLRVLIAYKDLLRNHFGPISRWYFKRFRFAQMEAAKKLKDKDCLEVAFFLAIPGMWKADEVFKAMQRHPHFHPYAVIYPFAVYKDFVAEEEQRTIDRCREYVEKKGFEYVIPYDEKRRKWLDIRSVVKPDIVVFTNPYKDSYPKYYVDHFKEIFTCYIPYGFSSISLLRKNYDSFFINLVGLHFVETELHLKMVAENSRNKAENAVVTGYPATEVFLRDDHVPKDLWKPQSKAKKKVIFAPHHSIDQKEYTSLFLEVCDVMLEMAEKYKDAIQFAFKPHQVLLFKLQQLWGVEKTKAYYDKWDALENGQLVSDGYVDLFLTSDAMIHECGSFTTEYLFVRKPVMYLCSETDMTGKFNEFGIHSFNCHYHGRTREDIDRFLQEVVIEGNDPMKPVRDCFFEEYLKPKEGLLPSQKILKVLEEVVNG